MAFPHPGLGWDLPFLVVVKSIQLGLVVHTCHLRKVSQEDAKFKATEQLNEILSQDKK